MNDLIDFIPALFTGIILGILFFGGLWLTVKKGLNARLPALWFVSSFILRMGVVLAGFYYVSQHSWQKMLMTLAAFLIARMIVIRITKKTVGQIC